ncbi:alpha/beta hydrolase [Leifsonia sp. Root227]|uniref:alpha/beta hydrolase n=1 Tax=Leifsonia sp. Root227 TaxID=1736496 RepID=UPI001F43CC2D|nr:alpha/beta hydrolase [Leifsonia sp. Root227]
MSNSPTASTPAADSTPPPGRRMRKGLKVTLLSIAGVLAVVVVGLIGTTTVNAIASASEADDIERYGRLVDVDGKKMNVAVQGAGDQTVVLLPGFGTASPVLDFAPLVDELKSHYRVVVVEPFGYGLSDETEKPRTSANIAGEVHEALQQLSIDRYALMGHSIAGIYGLKYVNLFRDEVTAFVGIDSSVPTQPGMDAEFPIDALRTAKSLGLVRVLSAAAGDPYAGLPFSDEQKKQMGILSLRNGFTATYADEMEHFASNFRDAQRLSFPKELPLLLFVQDDNTDVPGWLALHEEQAAASDRSELVRLKAGHYLHHTKSPEIAAAAEAFLAAG